MTLDDPLTAASQPALLPLEEAWARYEALRPRLPQAGPPPEGWQIGELMEVCDTFDAFLFDSFGVLNVGETAIAGAASCLDALRARGKVIRILTNAASYTGDAALAKYRRLGLGVAREEIISSRDIALAHLEAVAPGLRWGAIAAEGDGFEDAGASRLFDLLDGPEEWDAAEGILFLSSARWTLALQDRLVQELTRRPRPVVIGNPDLVAPREDGLTIEPGFWGHDLQDRTGLAPRFFGKPYPEAFERALSGLDPARSVMIGDTLHTDILGGAAAGTATALVTDHGIFAGRDTAPYIRQSGIAPDLIMPSI